MKTPISFVGKGRDSWMCHHNRGYYIYIYIYLKAASMHRWHHHGFVYQAPFTAQGGQRKRGRSSGAPG